MSWSKRIPKYSKGAKITSLQEIADAAKRGDWIYIHHKPQHPSIITSMQFGNVWGMIARGALAVAVRNQGFPYVFNAEHWGDEMGWLARCSEIPALEIREFTREAVIREVHAAVTRHIPFRSARVDITFVVEKHSAEVIRAKELLP